MLSSYLWLSALGPLALLSVALFPAAENREAAAATSRRAVAAALVALLVALLTAAMVARWGPMRTQVLGPNGIGLELYVDSLSVTMFCLVAFVGLIVVLYSRNYMDGDAGQSRFTRLLCLTLVSVLFVIVSGNVLAFVLAWIATSLSLQQLLLFYPERPAAVLASRKKFITSRLGDACLIVAMVLLYRLFGSLDYSVIFSAAQAFRGGDIPATIDIVSVLFVCAALLKSAQFPTHGWLIEVMETPTPVSALLHAGIVNAGGFLVLRFSNIISLSEPSLNVLAIVGGLTALFGSMVMLTQTSIKVTLAYSTVAQMGFMMLECGLAAFPAALLHIVAHSLYKAHAFLSSGSVIDIARASWTRSPGGKPHPGRLVFAIVGVLAVAFGVSRVFGASLTEQPGVFALGAVLLLGLIHLVASGIDERPNVYVVGRVLLLAVVVGVAYFALQIAVERLLVGSLPPTQALRGPLDLAIVAAVVLFFAVVTFVQGMLPTKNAAPGWQALYAHISNGFYVNTLFNRLLRAWPERSRKTAPSTI